MAHTQPDSESGPIRPSVLLFAFAALLAVACAAVWFRSPITSLADAVLIVGLATLATVSLLVPLIIRERSASLASLADALALLKDQTADLEVVRREHYKSRTANEGLVAKAAEYVTTLDKLASRVEHMAAAQERVELDLIGHRQAAATLRRDSEEWRSRVIEFLDSCSRALDMEGLDPKALATIEKQVSDFTSLLETHGMTIVRPRTGDLFDGRTQEVSDRRPNAAVPMDSVVGCVGWGYAFRGEIVRKARVIISSGKSETEPLLPPVKPEIGTEPDAVLTP